MGESFSLIYSKSEDKSITGKEVKSLILPKGGCLAFMSGMMALFLSIYLDKNYEVALLCLISLWSQNTFV